MSVVFIVNSVGNKIFIRAGVNKDICTHPKAGFSLDNFSTACSTSSGTRFFKFRTPDLS